MRFAATSAVIRRRTRDAVFISRTHNLRAISGVVPSSAELTLSVPHSPSNDNIPADGAALRIRAVATAGERAAARASLPHAPRGTPWRRRAARR